MVDSPFQTLAVDFSSYLLALRAPEKLSSLNKSRISFSSGDGDHGLIAVFSAGFFGVVLGGGTGVRARRWEKC